MNTYTLTEPKKYVHIRGMFKELLPTDDLNESFVFEWNGEYQLEVSNVDGVLKVTNGVNGWGRNCKDEFKDAEVEILQVVPPLPSGAKKEDIQPVRENQYNQFEEFYLENYISPDIDDAYLEGIKLMLSAIWLQLSPSKESQKQSLIELMEDDQRDGMSEVLKDSPFFKPDLYSRMYIDCGLSDDMTTTEKLNQLFLIITGMEEGSEQWKAKCEDLEHRNLKLLRVLNTCFNALLTYGSHPIIESMVLPLLNSSDQRDGIYGGGKIVDAIMNCQLVEFDEPLTEPEKKKMLDFVMGTFVMKPLLWYYKQMELKKGIEAMVIEDGSKEEFIVSFKTAEEWKKGLSLPNKEQEDKRSVATKMPIEPNPYPQNAQKEPVIDWERLEGDCEDWCRTLPDSPPPIKVMEWLKSNLTNYIK